MSTNARSATKMMSQPIEIKIFKNIVLMIVKEQKCQKEQKQLKPFHKHGDKPTVAVPEHITQLPEPLGKGLLSAARVFDVEKLNLWLIMKITTSLWMLFGFASHATTPVIKS
jgi:hypothetical protein